MTNKELKAIIAAKMDDPNTTASDILATILAALQEPTEEMLNAAEKEDRDENYCVTYSDYWTAMLNASPLGEQSE